MFMVMNLCMMSIMLMMVVFNYMLVVLMVMELVVLSVSMMMMTSLSIMMKEFFMIYYLIFSVCESVLGLMILVLIIRFNGNEFYQLINLMKF